MGTIGVKRFVVVAAGLSLMVGCDSRPPAAVAGPAPQGPANQPVPGAAAAMGGGEEINPRLLRRFQPVGGAAALERPAPEKVTLGRLLFFDKRLSRNQDVACNSCHFLDRFGIDGRSTSIGSGGR